MAFRYDGIEVKVKGKAKRTKEGFVYAEAVVTRAGVFKYLGPDGKIRRELRPPSEVFKKTCMDSIKMIPMSDDHPVNKLIDITNCSDVIIGFTGENVHRDGYDLMTNLKITDEFAVEEIELGKKELSLGYSCELQETPGVWDGPEGPEPYDAIQVNIVNNHLALCKVARAGHSAQVPHFDSLDAVQIKGDSMEVELELEKKEKEQCEDACKGDELKEKFDQLNAKYEAMMKEKEELRAKNDEMTEVYNDLMKRHEDLCSKHDAMLKKEEELKTAKCDSVQRIDELEAQVAEIPNLIKAAIVERRDAEVRCSIICKPKEFEHLDSVIEIKKLGIKKIYPNYNFEGKSEGIISDRFDAAYEAALERQNKREEEEDKQIKTIIKETIKVDKQDSEIPFRAISSQEFKNL